MVSTDPVADMLSRIRNAISARQSEVDMPHSKLKADVASILVKNGFLVSATEAKDGELKLLHIVINDDQANPKITEIHRLSRPGRRHYVNARGIPAVRRGRGLVVISTSKGVMSGADAKTKKLGGELICEVF